MRKPIKEDGTPLSSSEKNKRYRQKKKQKQKEQQEMLMAFLNGTEDEYIRKWAEHNTVINFNFWRY